MVDYMKSWQEFLVSKETKRIWRFGYTVAFSNTQRLCFIHIIVNCFKTDWNTKMEVTMKLITSLLDRQQRQQQGGEVATLINLHIQSVGGLYQYYIYNSNQILIF